MFIFLLPVAASDNFVPAEPAEAQLATCSKTSLSSNSVTASGNDGNGPQRTIDNRLNTRWSSSGHSWIQYDLGSSKTICNVDIAWYRGNIRVNSFSISVSNDKVNFANVFSGKSSGATNSFERYNFPDVNARYVRITVTSNTENSWASISEVAIYSRTSSSISCLTPQVTSITANGNDGNIPQNTIDNNLDTRWSNLGLQSWVQYDLGVSTGVCHVDIAWYRGDLRVNTFTLSVSDDNANFQPIFNGKSSGTITSFERYDIPDVNARYVRITVTGNTENTWASISEFKINSGTSSPPPPPPPPPPSDDFDLFGIKKVYPTKSNGEEWFMNMANPTGDSRSFLYTEPANSLTKNADGTWKIKAPFVRYHAYTSSGYHPELITTYNQKSLATKGYMQSPNDWKNVEMTGYIKVNSYQQDDDTAWYNRGGRHTSAEPCEGTGYKGDVYYSGKTRFPKEQWHNGGYSFSPTVPATTSIEDRWVGIKYVVYNFVQNGKTVVKLENWLDNNNNGNWAKIYEYTDAGGWGNQGTQCGGDPDQIITWGGPIATFRWDSATDVDIKNFSVREIQPPQ